jgi:signal transduction histidine kinase
MNVYVEQSIASTYTLTGLINDLMDQAKIEASTFTLDYNYFSMFDVINATFGVMSFEAQNRKISLQIEFDISKAFIFHKLYGDRRRF